MDSNNLLNLAKSRIFSLGLEDASARISIMNSAFGVGKIIYALENVGLDSSSVYAFFAPDGGISRNFSRWEAGFSYGCLLKWNDGKSNDSVIFPQIRPNACGIIVCKLKSATVPSYDFLQKKLSQSEAAGIYVDEKGIKLNLGISNHFIEVCTVKNSSYRLLDKGDTVALIHTSPSELKEDLYNLRKWEEKGGRWIDTPLGRIFALVGKTAQAYYNKYLEVEEFGRQKRLKIAQILFDEFEVICNPTHQGLSNINTARLGLYDSTDNSTSGGKPIFPLTLRWDLPIYLIEGMQNLDDIFYKEIKKTKSDKNKILENFGDINILPHGGGYSLPFSSRGWSIKQNGDGRSLIHRNGRKHFVFHKPSELPYHYRGKEVLDKIVKYGLGRNIARLDQIYTLKY